MFTRSLPPRPNLEQLKLQAKELRRAHAEGKRPAAARIAAHHPRFKGKLPEEVLTARVTLADAQLAVAREYGFESWARLKHRVELGDRIAGVRPHPRFEEALAALKAGDVERLRTLITEVPELLHARTNLEPPYGYFTGATLLHHVAGNPTWDGPLPANIVEVARLLLERGADANAMTLGPNGGTTMALVITSKQASDANVSGALIELLLRHGAALDLNDRTGAVVQDPGRRDVLELPLANHAPRAAEKLIELGARRDVCAAAALGRMDLLRDCFDAAGRLRRGWFPRRRGKAIGERDAIGLALLFAYVNARRDAVEFLLEKDGNWDMTGVNNGTALHRAAWGGDLEMVRRLVGKGADVHNRDNPFHSTPMSWAQHNKQAAVFQWIREHCDVDLHDAVCFDLREHVEARLREDAASINRRLDQWEFPQCTPLHWAAWPHISDVDGRHSHDPVARAELVKLLLDRGADVNAVAGNGATSLDVAHEGGAKEIVAVLERYGAKSAAEL